MQAIILAAGMGKRLKDYTKNKTKCMVEVNGRTLIDRLLHQLDQYELFRIIIVTGFARDRLVDYIGSMQIKTPIVFVDNAIYDKTNNIYSLSLVKDYLKEDDTLLFESDIIFDDSVLDKVLKDPRKTLAVVDAYKPWMDGTCLRLDYNDKIIDFISGNNIDYLHTEGCYKTVNIYKFSKQFSNKQYVPFLEAYQVALGKNQYYEQVLKVITMLEGAEIEGMRLQGEKWYEIDDEQDLDIAEIVFDDNIETKIQRIEKRHGGYWRFPKIIDFCYLVNPYFPPPKMCDELKASFDTMLKSYPSGMAVNSLLAAKNLGIHSENVVVGNGAAELIKTLMEYIEGDVGIVLPTFEEYLGRIGTNRIVPYETEIKGFRYTAEELKQYFGEKDVSALIIINPDNPTGNYLSYFDVIELIKWTQIKGMKLILDESFIDFADDSFTCIDQTLLEENQHMYIVRSLSKTYGIPGLRLGVLASGDAETIAVLKRNVPIWNINSFAEFFMQIQGKYLNDYFSANKRFKAERKRFYEALSKIGYIKPLPSQANFFMIELMGRYTAGELTNCLLEKYGILIKNLSKKVGEKYIRIAVRDELDDKKLEKALIELASYENGSLDSDNSMTI